MVIAIVIAVVLLAVGIGAGYVLYPAVNKSSSTSTPSLTETGSSLFYPLMTRWAGNYSAATISATATGSGTGQNDAILNLVNMGASDGYLANASSNNVVNFAAAISAQYIFYNIPGVSGHINLNGTILGMIYAGNITNWNNSLIKAANPGVPFPSATIDPIFRSDSSGDTFLFSSLCYMSDPTWPFGYGTKALVSSTIGTGAVLNSGMVSAIAASKDSIGYVGISFAASAISDGLQYAAIGDNNSLTAAGGVNPLNYVVPSPTNISQDANLGLQRLAYSTYGLAVSLILGGSWAGPITLVRGLGGTNPAPNTSPYPLVNIEYLIFKLSPTSGTVVSSTNLAATVAFLHWAISYGNFGTNSVPSVWLSQVGFLPLTPELGGYDTQILASVQT